MIDIQQYSNWIVVSDIKTSDPKAIINELTVNLVSADTRVQQLQNYVNNLIMTGVITLYDAVNGIFRNPICETIGKEDNSIRSL